MTQLHCRLGLLPALALGSLKTGSLLGYWGEMTKQHTDVIYVTSRI